MILLASRDQKGSDCVLFFSSFASLLHYQLCFQFQLMMCSMFVAMVAAQKSMCQTVVHVVAFNKLYFVEHFVEKKKCLVITRTDLDRVFLLTPQSKQESKLKWRCRLSRGSLCLTSGVLKKKKKQLTESARCSALNRHFI